MFNVQVEALHAKPQTNFQFHYLTRKRPVLLLGPSKIGKSQKAVLDAAKRKRVKAFCHSVVANMNCSNDFYSRSFFNNNHSTYK